MTYLVYFLFVVWLLSGLGGLLAGALIKFGPADAPRVSHKPAWFHFASAAFTLLVAASLYMLYSSDAISEWLVLIVGTIVLLPDLLFMLFRKRLDQRAS